MDRITPEESVLRTCLGWLGTALLVVVLFILAILLVQYDPGPKWNVEPPLPTTTEGQP